MSTQKIGACVLLLDKTQTKVLLGKRLNSYESGLFGLPGGTLELTEKIKDSATRELFEETGIKVSNLEYVAVIREFQKTYNFIHFAFVCKRYEGEPTIMEPEKCEKWEFFPPNSLPENILPAHKAAIEVFFNKEPINFKDI